MTASEPGQPEEGESPLVCYCRRVRESTLLRAIEGGDTTIEALIESTGAATGCGTCRFELVALLEEHATRDEESGRVGRRLLLVLAFTALVVTTCTIGWKIGLGRNSARTDAQTTERQIPEDQIPEGSPTVSAPGDESAGSQEQDRSAGPGSGAGPPTEGAAASRVGAADGPRRRNTTADADALANDATPSSEQLLLQVVDIFGEPLADSTVDLLVADRPPRRLPIDRLARVFERELGRRPEPEAPGTGPGTEAFVWIRHPEFAPRLALLSAVRLGTPRITLESRPGTRLRIVDDLSGQPVARARIEWRPTHLDSRIAASGEQPFRFGAESGADGLAILRGLPDVQGTFRVESASHRTLEAPGPRRSDSDTGPQILRLRPGRSIRAMLIDWNGDPVPNTQVTATPHEGGPSARAVSNAEGWLRFDGMANGGFEAMAEVDQTFVPLERAQDERRKLAVLVLPRPRRIDGSVVDHGGLRLGRAHLRLVSQGQEIRTRTRGDGRFSIECWPALPARLTAWANGFSQRSEWIHSDSADPIEFRLRRAPLLRGRVVGPDGEPIAAARITIVDPTGRQRSESDSVESGRDGSFALECDHRATGARLRIEAEGQPIVFSEPLEGLEGEAVDLGDLRVPTPAHLQVHIDAPPGFSLPRLRLLRSGSSPTEDLLMTQIDAERFASGPVAPGDYLVILLPLPMHQQSPRSFRVTLGPGPSMRLRFREVRSGGQTAPSDASEWNMEPRESEGTPK